MPDATSLNQPLSSDGDGASSWASSSRTSALEGGRHGRRGDGDQRAQGRHRVAPRSAQAGPDPAAMASATTKPRPWSSSATRSGYPESASASCSARPSVCAVAESSAWSSAVPRPRARKPAKPEGAPRTGLPLFSPESLPARLQPVSDRRFREPLRTGRIGVEPPQP